MSDTQKTRNASVDGITIAQANQRVAAAGGNIDDLAAELGMNVESLRPRLTQLRKGGVQLSKLTAKPRGNRKVDFDAINAAVAEVNDELGIDA